nr:MAG TPA: hypothetical protein [Caudoviricetes sp.]
MCFIQFRHSTFPKWILTSIFSISSCDNIQSRYCFTSPSVKS